MYNMPHVWTEPLGEPGAIVTRSSGKILMAFKNCKILEHFTNQDKLFDRRPDKWCPENTSESRGVFWSLSQHNMELYLNLDPPTKQDGDPIWRVWYIESV